MRTVSGNVRSADPAFAREIEKYFTSDDLLAKTEFVEEEAAAHTHRQGRWLSSYRMYQFLVEPPGTFPETEKKLQANVVEIFWTATNILEEESNRNWRILTALLTLAGLMLGGVILLQSVYFVIEAAVQK